jgi:16S rRNA (uracil1498-N3)-methyltransferase
MRLNAGDEVILFDGSGSQFAARIDSMGRQQIELAVLERQEIDVELRGELTVGVALPKADRQRWLVEKLTEIGANRLVPLRTRRSVVHPDEKSLGKLRRTVIEASKQCGRNRLMQIQPLISFEDFLASAPDDADRWLADTHGTTASQEATTRPIYLAVGPEGGFTDDEVMDAKGRGWQTVSLGARILRIETACLVLASLAAQRLFK